MQHKKTWIGALVLLTALTPATAVGGSSTVLAFATGWNPGSFTLDAVTANKINNSIPVGVTFRAGASGSFRVQGDIHPFDGMSNPGWSILHLDTDDRSSSHSVEVRIYRTPNGPFSGTGARELVASLVSSDGTGYHTDFTVVSHTWDFDNFIYWIGLQVSRTAGSPNITAYRVVLHM